MYFVHCLLFLWYFFRFAHSFTISSKKIKDQGYRAPTIRGVAEEQKVSIDGVLSSSLARFLCTLIFEEGDDPFPFFHSSL